MNNQAISKNKSSNIIFPSLSILLSFSVLPVVYYLFNKKLTKLKEDNHALSILVNKLQVTNESINVRYNNELNMRDAKKDIEDKIKGLSDAAAKELSGLVSALGINTDRKEEEKDNSAENDEEISVLLERIGNMKEKLNIIKNESVAKINKKAKADFHNHVNLLQVKANKDYLTKTENDNMKNSKIKHYRRYNHTEILTLERQYNDKMNYPHDIFSSVFNRIYSLPEKFIFLFEQIAKKETALYSQIEKSEKEISDQNKKIIESEQIMLNQMKTLQTKDAITNQISYKELTNIIGMIRNQKAQIKTTLKDFLGMRFDFNKYYDVLFNHFGKNFKSRLIYTFGKHNDFNEAFTAFKESTANKECLLFIFNTESNHILGGYISKAFKDFEKFENYEENSFSDFDSFLFHFNTKDKKFTILNALDYSKDHIHFMKNDYGIRFAIGDIKKEEGLSISLQNANDSLSSASMAELSPEEKYLSVIAGKKSNKYRSEPSYSLFNNYSDVSIKQKIKSFKILQLSFIDN